MQSLLSAAKSCLRPCSSGCWANSSPSLASQVTGDNLGRVRTDDFQAPPSGAQALADLEAAASLLQATSLDKDKSCDTPIILVLADLQGVMVGADFCLGDLRGVLGPREVPAVLTRALGQALRSCLELCGNLRPILTGRTSIWGHTLDLGPDLTVLTEGITPALSNPPDVLCVLQHFLATEQLRDDFVQQTCERLAGPWMLVP